MVMQGAEGAVGLKFESLNEQGSGEARSKSSPMPVTSILLICYDAAAYFLAALYD